MNPPDSTPREVVNWNGTLTKPTPSPTDVFVRTPAGIIYSTNGRYLMSVRNQMLHPAQVPYLDVEEVLQIGDNRFYPGLREVLFAPVIVTRNSPHEIVRQWVDQYEADRAAAQSEIMLARATARTNRTPK